jgi:hypothetical protein
MRRWWRENFSWPTSVGCVGGELLTAEIAENKPPRSQRKASYKNFLKIEIVVNRLPSLFVVLLEAIETPLTKGTFLCAGMGGTGQEFSGS